jgi:hypothetical protein
MRPDAGIRALGWQHELWGLVRLYRSQRVRKMDEWLKQVQRGGGIALAAGQTLPVSADMQRHLSHYLLFAERQMEIATNALRSEHEALQECQRLGLQVTQTRTRSADHHQSSKALVAQVSHLAARHCDEAGLAFDVNPQRRAVWLEHGVTHVSARNLDGVVPSLFNPKLIWEIKEYWGVTSGGSKMSDAVYECQLVGSELRNYELVSRGRVTHVVFLDGKDQWGTRRSDLVRFVDLASQGLIDRLVIGKQVATEWPEILAQVAVEGH